MTLQGWNKKHLSDLIESLNAGVSVNSDDDPAKNGEFGILKTSSVTDGVFKPKENKRIWKKEITRAKVSPKKDRIIISRMNSPTLVGASAYIEKDYDLLFLPDRLWQLEPKPNFVSMKWLAHVLASPPYRRTLTNRATGTSNSMKNIPKESVLSLDVLVPPVKEQGTIAEVLSTWDLAIEKTERLIAAKERCLEGCIKKLFKISDSEGRITPFSKLLAESTVPGHSGKYARKITVKLYGKGVFPKEEKREGSENTQYYVRRAGQLIFSKLDFLNGAIGLIPDDLDGYESTLDLPTFDIAQNVNPIWLLAYLSRPDYYTRQVGLARGQRKARRVHPTDFLKSELRVPPKPSQDWIAKVLIAAKLDFELTARLASTYRKQKRGLMQKLLTGRWRVKVR